VRLALVIEHFRAGKGGAEQYAVRLFRELAARGWDVTVVAGTGEACDGVRLVYCPPSERAQRLRSLNADIVIDWGVTTPADLHRLGGGVHQEYLRMRAETASGPARLWRRIQPHLPAHRRIIRREHRLLSRPQAHVLAVSEFVADQVRRAVPEAAERLTVLHNGVDVDVFRPAASPNERRSAREKFGLPPDAIVFLLVANNLRLKNFNLLASVFDSLPADLPPARLAVAGNRKPPKSRPWLVWTGHTDHPAALYRAADVLLHPTLFDACSNAVLEAMASGLAVVSSDRNGSAELIASGRDGLVLPVTGRSRRELERLWSEAVIRLAQNNDERRNMGSEARNTACKNSFDRYVTRFEQLLERILHRSR